MIIEKLRLEDVPELLELYKELTPYENSLSKSTETYKKMIDDDRYLLLVVKENNEIVASALAVCCLVLALDGGSFLAVEDVIVRNGLRGKGVGRMLMDEIDKFAAKNNCGYSILVSSDYRKSAHKFYENCGFIDGVRGFRKVY